MGQKGVYVLTLIFLGKGFIRLLHFDSLFCKWLTVIPNSSQPIEMKGCAIVTETFEMLINVTETSPAFLHSLNHEFVLFL